MKKISIIVGVCIILAAMPMTSAVSLFAPNHASLIQNPARPTFTNGTFSGVFAMKNESGYIPLGDFNGTYDVGGWFGSFAGTWTMDEGNVSGAMSGWVLGYIVYGIINTTGATNQIGSLVFIESMRQIIPLKPEQLSSEKTSIICDTRWDPCKGCHHRKFLSFFLFFL